MMQLNEWLIQVTILALICACAVSYPSIHSETDNTKLTSLLNELREELEVGLAQNQGQRTNLFSEIPLPVHHAVNQQKSVPYGSYNNFPVKDHPLLSVFENRGDNSGDIGMEKRQGSWDYDYGLGGGRFGKRNGFMDYSLGGGRFGRDVDHVVQLEGETVDFEDVLDG